MPVAIKENVDQAGCGDDQRRRKRSQGDGGWPTARRGELKARRAPDLLGRTNTPAFSFRLDTENALRGPYVQPGPRTAYAGRLERLGLGFGGGRHGPLATAMTYGGSIRFRRWPAGSPGSARPSAGCRCSIHGDRTERSISAASCMSVQGPIARTVRDVRLGLAAMCGPTPAIVVGAGAALRRAACHPASRCGGDRARGFLGGATLHPTVAKALKQAAVWLADAGYEVVETRTPGFTGALDAWFGMQLPEIRLFMWPYIEKFGDEGIRRAMGLMLESRSARPARPTSRCSPTAPPSSARGSSSSSGCRWCSSRSTRAGLRARLRPGKRGAHHTGVAGALHAHGRAGHRVPGLAVPTGVVDSLPTGVQILAPRFREDLCLAAGEAIEARSGMRSRVPVDPVW